MVHAKNYETVSTFVEVMRRILWPLFPDTVYIDYIYSPYGLLGVLKVNLW